MTNDATNVPQRHRKRYLSGHYNSINQIADPDSMEDSTASTVRDYVVNNKLWVLIGGAFVVVSTFLAFRWIATTAGNLLSNPIAQVALLVLVTAGVSYYVGRRHQLAVFTNVDEFTANGPNGPKRFFGEYVTDANGKNERFEVYKGFTRLGNPTEKLTVGDLAAEWARKAEYRGFDADDPAAISLHGQFAKIAHTDFGTMVAQQIDEIEPMDHGGKSVLRATIPDMARESDVPKIRQQLEEAREENQKLETENQTLREQRDEAYEIARKGQDEVIDPFIDRYTRLRSVDGRNRRRRGADDEPGIGPSRDETADDLGVDIELEDDD